MNESLLSLLLATLIGKFIYDNTPSLNYKAIVSFGKRAWKILGFLKLFLLSILFVKLLYSKKVDLSLEVKALISVMAIVGLWLSPYMIQKELN
jgi:hypothetical protein